MTPTPRQRVPESEHAIFQGWRRIPPLKGEGFRQAWRSFLSKSQVPKQLSFYRLPQRIREQKCRSSCWLVWEFFAQGCLEEDDRCADKHIYMFVRTKVVKRLLKLSAIMYAHRTSINFTARYGNPNAHSTRIAEALHSQDAQPSIAMACHLHPFPRGRNGD